MTETPQVASLNDDTIFIREDVHEAAIDAALAREAGLREALSFYANPEVYRPHPHGIAFDRRDISHIAIAALAVKP